MEIFWGFSVLVAIALSIFLGVQLFDLMRRPDADFPGRNDKILWVAIMLILPLVGAVIYVISRPRPSPTNRPRSFPTKSPAALKREMAAIQSRRAADSLERAADEGPDDPMIEPKPA